MSTDLSEIDRAAKNLHILSSRSETPPSFLGIVTATGSIAYTRDDGVAVIPLDCLGP